MTKVSERLDPYVSQVASEWPGRTSEQLRHVVDGSLLFVDISGFTNLSERLARKGRIGAEELTSVLSGVFGRMLEIVFERGGSLLKFGGDALLLLFQGRDHAVQACAAAVEMRAALREASKTPTSVGKINLRMSSGVHSGAIDLFLVGKSHRELIVTGPAASVTTEMEGTASAGEIVISDSVRAQVPSDFAGKPKGHGWLLRKQKITTPPAGFNAPSEVGDAELTDLVPLGLRNHLGTGITDSEHRVATVGFVKFSGVDDLYADEGADAVASELDRLVSQVQEAADREAVTFLATDIDANGGKIILVAGVPASQHDDEGRMLRAARSIVHADTRLDVRVGINRGHVFAGAVGAAFRSTYTVMGDTVNLAARMMAAADPGEVYASPSALNLSSTLFRTEALEPFSVKGKDELVHAYSVFEETGVRPPDLGQDLPFHGRDGELEMLVSIVTTCARLGRGGMMTITGDTGIGKSRLIAEVIDRCPGLATLLIQAEPNGTDRPYWAFRDPMRRMLGIDQSERDQLLGALTATVADRAPELISVLPLLGDVLHVEVEETEETNEIDPKFRPERTADAILALLEALHLGPLVVVAEDGQWLDAASTLLLSRLGDAAASRPWTVIVTARRGEEEFESLGDEIALHELDDESIRAIAIEATMGAPLRPHELQMIVKRSNGNPLFLSEILKVVKETGSVSKLPDSLDSVVSKEIDTLAPLVRQILRYSSVLGSSFRRNVLNEFLAPDKIKLDQATQRELSRFLEADGRSRLRFMHAVVHDVAYEGLSYRRRRELHARAGAVLERLSADDLESAAEMLARHFAESGHHDKAWHYSLVAAKKARDAYANTEAATHYRRAVESAAHLDAIDPSDIASAWTSLGEVSDLAGQYEDARAAFSRALKVDGSDPARSADLYLRRAEAWFGSGNIVQAKRNLTLGRNLLSDDDVRTLAKLDAYEASLHAANGDPVKAHRAATSAILHARATGDEEALARAYGALDWANFMMGSDEPRHGEEAIEILDRLGHLDQSALTMNMMGAFAYLEGNWDRAIEWYERSVEAADRSGNVFHAANTRANIAEVMNSQRKYDEAIPLLAEAERTFRASGSELVMPFVTLQQARAKVGLGAADEGVEILERLFEQQIAAGDSYAWPETAIQLGEALVIADRPDDALAQLTRFENDLSASAARFQPAIARVRAMAHIANGHIEQAVGQIEQADQLLVSGEDPYEEMMLLEVRVALEDGADEDVVQRLNILCTELGVQTAAVAAAV